MSDQKEQSQGQLRKQRKPFVMSPTHLFTNPEISSIAKNLWNVLDSKPDGWIFFWSEILKHFKEGRNAVKRSMKELESFGYVKRKRAKKGNIFCGMDIEVFYDPTLPFDQENQGSARVTENGSSENQIPENGVTESGKSESRSAEIRDTKKERSKQDLSKKDLFFLNPKTTSKEQLKIHHEKEKMKCDFELWWLTNESQGWKKVENRLIWLDRYELNHREKHPEKYVEKSDVRDFRTTEEEPKQIQELRASIRTCLNFRYGGQEEARIYRTFFDKKSVEKVDNKFVIHCEKGAEAYAEVLEKINLRIEVKS